MTPPCPAVFLDRDGVLNELVWDPDDGRCESPLKPDHVRLAEGAAAAVRILRAAGWQVLVASNQPAAAKGKASEEDLRAVHDRVVALLAAEGVEIDGWRYCLHRHEDGCACRKPKPGMLLDLARRHAIDLRASWMIGDTDADVSAGRAAGARTVLLTSPASAHKRRHVPAPDLVADDLREAAAQLSALRGAELTR